MLHKGQMLAEPELNNKDLWNLRQAGSCTEFEEQL
jgi:hypothetical protein